MTRPDPRTFGADCDNCPLNTREPVVPPHVIEPKKKVLAFVSDYPGRDETQQNRFFCGPTGEIINNRLWGHLKAPRHKMHDSNALLCWPAGKLSPAEWKKAIAACRPRLERELRAVKPKLVLAAGGKVTKSLTNKGTLAAWVGAPIQGADYFVGGRKKGTKVADFTDFTILPTYQPAMVFRDNWAYIPILRKHFQRAWWLATGRLQAWDWGHLILDVGREMEQGLRWILRNPQEVGADIETHGLNGWSPSCYVTRIGFSVDRFAISVPWRDYQGRGDVFVEGVEDGQTHEEGRIRSLVLRILASNKHLFIWQNGRFDRMFLRAQGFQIGKQHWDCLDAHLLYSPGTPHDLGFQGAQEFHSERWKTNFRASKDGGFEK